jgi:biopolymer transport protein ExbD
MEFQTKQKRNVSLDIHALIDVVFLLLIFFMVSTTFLEKPGMKLDLPSAETSTSEQMKDIVIIVTEDMQIHFRGQNITMEQLEIPLKNALEKSEEKQVIIRGDRKVEYGFIVSIMDIARKSGATGITVATAAKRQ